MLYTNGRVECPNFEHSKAFQCLKCLIWEAFYYLKKKGAENDNKRTNRSKRSKRRYELNNRKEDKRWQEHQVKIL